jgi:hypothetical protein
MFGLSPYTGRERLSSGGKLNKEGVIPTSRYHAFFIHGA